ncbi:MAG: GerMN domain-containing protein [Syntrophomonas sp.]
MGRKIIIGLAVIILAVCLISGGCSSPATSSKAWQDLIKLVPEKPKKQEVKTQQEVEAPAPKSPSGETVTIKLYFARSGEEELAVESRTVVKTQAIARKTMEELIKGPQSKEFLPVFPAGTALRDINIKTDGICVVDLNAKVRGIKSQQEEKLMVQAVSNSLGQFPTIEGVSFMIDGQMVESINGGVDLSTPVKPVLNQ